MRYNGKDLQNLREAAMHQISEDAQPFENLVEQDARDSSSRVDVTFVADADQRSYENITRDPALKKLPGFLGLGKTIFRPRKGKAEFTFRAANKLSKVGMNKKDEEKFKKLLKKHGLKLVDTIYEGSEKLDEKKLPTARKIVSGLGDADGPFTVVVMKNKKVIHQESTKFAKMLPAIVKELAEKMPNATIAIENKTGQIVKVFK